LGTTLKEDNGRQIPLAAPGYVLDVLDPEVVILRRDDGSMVGAFSTAGYIQ
jgi:hypothetical protein